MVNLHKTLNPISRTERVKINENWDMIMSRFSSLQLQITFLAGDEVDVIIERINDVIAKAQDATTNIGVIVDEVNSALADLTTVIDNAISATTAANESASNANTLISSMTTLKGELETLQQDLNNIVVQEKQREANEVTRESNEATRISAENQRVLDETTRKSNEQTRVDNEASRNNTFDTKVSEVNKAITDGNDFLLSSVHLRAYSPMTQYIKNNEVMYNGSTWRCLQDCISITPAEGVNWTLVAQRGIDGEGSVSSVNGIHPDINGNVTIDSTSLGGVAQEVFAAHANNADIHVSKSDKTKWNNKYDKPSTGIPSTDLASTVQTSLSNADTALQNVSTLQTTVDSNSDKIDVLTGNLSTHETKKASTTELGHVKVDGTTITIDGSGTIKGANTYTLPTATPTVLGGIKVGQNLSITGDGTLNASGGTPPDATTTQKGIVQLNDSMISSSTTTAATSNAVYKVSNAKADKVQDPLLSTSANAGWTVTNTRYFKDNFGMVHVFLDASKNIAMNNGEAIFKLPVGYRPEVTAPATVTGKDTGSANSYAVNLYVTSAGDVCLGYGNGTSVRTLFGYICLRAL